jgi:hypothetical protein
MADIRYAENLVSYDDTAADGTRLQYGLIEVTVYEGEDTAQLNAEGLADGVVTGVELLLDEDDLLALIAGATQALQAIRANA